MAIFEITSNKIEKIEETSFSDAGLKERADLQRLIRAQIDVISKDLLVIAEEFGEWEESRRRIDLLALDKEANIVVIELKRTADGGHMELQAIRYAAMISTLTFDRAVEIYAEYLSKMNSDIVAQDSMLEFLEWDEPDEDNYAQDVRMILVSADFSRELTTSVMWLNDHGLDIKCIRIKPYSDNDRILIDVQQVIPLPEAEQYNVRIREKAERERLDRANRAPRQQLMLEFWDGLLTSARSILDLFSSVSPAKSYWISVVSGVPGFRYSFLARKHDVGVYFYMRSDKEKNKSAFDYLHQRKEQVERSIGGPLEWRRCDDRKRSYITQTLDLGGVRNDRAEWPKIQKAMIDAMIRLEKAIAPHIDAWRNNT